MKITIPISVGELIDRITILEIKSTYTNNQYVIQELEELNSIKNQISFDISKYKDELKTINERLWKIEDEIRNFEDEKRFDENFIELARSVYLNNDKRAEVKRKLNEETNSFIREVKIYRKEIINDLNNIN